MRTGRQFVSFGLVGVVNTVIQYAVFVLLFRLVGVPMLAASAVGYACGLVNSYLMNHRWTFRTGRDRSRGEFLRFCLVNLVALGVNLLVLKALAGAGVLPEIAQAVAIGFSLGAPFTTTASVQATRFDPYRL